MQPGQPLPSSVMLLPLICSCACRISLEYCRPQATSPAAQRTRPPAVLGPWLVRAAILDVLRAARATEFGAAWPQALAIGYPVRMGAASDTPRMVDRFRGFLPVVVDVETGGFDCERDALLEIGAVPVLMNAEGLVYPGPPVSTHVVPFPGSNIDPRALEITGIDPTHPFRDAREEREALDLIFQPIRKLMRETECQRAILVGHNAAFDLGFINAAIRRTGHKRSPFHPFSAFDTVSLAGLAFGQTVLSRAVIAAGMEWNADEAHSAVYDAERTAQLFCRIVNRWKSMSDAWGGASALPLSA